MKKHTHERSLTSALEATVPWTCLDCGKINSPENMFCENDDRKITVSSPASEAGQEEGCECLNCQIEGTEDG